MYNYNNIFYVVQIPFILQLGSNNVLGPIFTSQSPSSVREFKLASLQPGATYVGTVVSVNTAGESKPTNFEFTTSHSVSLHLFYK